MTDRELMQQALDALEWNLPVIEDYGNKEQSQRQHKAITALRDRLVKPHIKVEGPMHVVCQCDKCKAGETKKMHPEMRKMWEDYFDKCFKEYDKHLRPWFGLTEIEIVDIEAEELTSASSETFSFARAIEDKLREKNT